MNKYKVSLENTKNRCDYEKFNFKSTKSLNSEINPIGQERAVEAIYTALNIEKKGFNLFLSGSPGCGKSSIIKAILTKRSKEKEAPSDWIYVYNFENKSKPISLELPNGEAKGFKKIMDNFIDDFIIQIPKIYQSKFFKNSRKEIIKEYENRENEYENKLSLKCRDLGFMFGKIEDGYNVTPFTETEDGITLFSSEDILKLSNGEKEKIERDQRKIVKLIDELYVKILDLEKKTRTKLEKHVKKSVKEALKISGFPDILKNNKISSLKPYLKSVKESFEEDALSFAALLIGDEFLTQYKKDMDIEELTNRYKVNLFINNKKLEGAPVIIDNNPTITSIFGMIEYVDDQTKGPISGFKHIKPGKIHFANGGYLVLEAMDLYKNPKLWDMLKRVIKNQEIQIGEDPHTLTSRISVKIEPQPIPVNLKVVLIGTPELHEYFMNYDDGFDRLFKIKAEFNTDIPRNRENEDKYAAFIGSKCVEDSLLHLNRKAVAKVIEYSSRLAEDQFMLSTSFSKIVDILVESDYIARSKNKKIITDNEILKTIYKIEYRLKKENEIFLQWIKDNIIYIDTTSSKIGEINGLTVLTSGEYSFGLPVKITAKTFVGDLGIVNIEREIRMSGKIHDKGVMTLSGYMGNIFAQDKALAFEASITFEQQYYHIDGDSASSTELYALLSSLSGVPIKQNLAVTGSVNQNGEIQAIGGVNEKIEGFFEICKHRGFDNNGILIPKANIRNLMLKDEVVDAIKDGHFSIYAVETIQEGIEILTNEKAGCIDTEGTIFYKVNEKLKYFQEIQEKE